MIGKFTLWSSHTIIDYYRATHMIWNVISNVTSPWQILDMLCLIWISHCILHLRIHIQCNIAMRNQFSQNRSMIVYISMTDLFIMYHYRCWRCYQLLQLDVVFTSKFHPIITKVWTGNHSNCIYNLVKKGTE